MYLFETVFDVSYLLFVTALGLFIIWKAKDNKESRLFGIMAVVLGLGDSFHLVPRIYAMWSPGGFEGNAAVLGTGQLITSVTMTIFYIILYRIWQIRYHKTNQKGLTVIILGLAFIRTALCFAPQNAWTSASAPVSWGIYRNIPFALMGIIIIVLFYQQARQTGDTAFRHMWLAVTLSFGFYAPVVLFAHLFPPIGALMMPKTLAYVWIVWMGFRAIEKKEAGS